jgi:hypothetical protein
MMRDGRSALTGYPQASRRCIACAWWRADGPGFRILDFPGLLQSNTTVGCLRHHLSGDVARAIGRSWAVEKPQSKHTQALGNVKRSGMGLVGYHAVVTAIQADELNATSDEE